MHVELTEINLVLCPRCCYKKLHSTNLSLSPPPEWPAPQHRHTATDPSPNTHHHIIRKPPNRPPTLHQNSPRNQIRHPPHPQAHNLAAFKRLGHHCSATESSLSSTLFPNNPNPSPPFHSFTVFLLELSPTSTPFLSPHPTSSLFPPSPNLSISTSLSLTQNPISSNLPKPTPSLLGLCPSSQTTQDSSPNQGSISKTSS
ncbi:hypothetical protein ACSBR2_030958 [Camellia fascicularis]